MNIMVAAVEQTRIAELVEQIEGAEVARDFWRSVMDQYSANLRDWRVNRDNAEHFDRQIDAARAELRSILGCDAYRLANAVGASS